MSTLSKKLLSVLVLVATATRSDVGFAFVAKKDGEALAKDGHVELNAAVENTPAGQIAARATPKGLELAPAPAAGATATAAAAPAAKPQFVIEDGIEVPKVEGRGRVGGTKYPFEALKVGQSFFVPIEAKKLGSTVSSANARYASQIVVDGVPQTRVNRNGATVPATKQERTFVVRSAEKDGVSGARVFRTA
jgi:hypothetical protein